MTRGPVVDCDAVAGFWPLGRIPMAPEDLTAALSRHKITEACVVSARGIFFDHRAGNREALLWAEASKKSALRFHPVATIDLRRFIGYKDEVREMSRAGVRLWRLFPERQGWDYDHPGFRRVALAVAEEGGTLFVKGKPGKILAGLSGVEVSLLIGAHFYDLAEALALEEAGASFRLTTAQLHGPGSIDIAAEALGADRLVFGTSAPLFAPGSAAAVFDACGLSEKSKRMVLYDTMAGILKGGYHDR
jgi:predicted TIM-barrel fold metal-dependent hydrolase